MAVTPGAQFNLAYRLIRRYGWQTITEQDWSLGIVRDTPRAAIPPGGSYDLVDYLIDNRGMLYRRGNVTTQCTGVGDSAGPYGVSIAPYDADNIKVIGFAFNGVPCEAFDCTNGVAAPIAGICNLPVDPPVFLVDKLLILDLGGFRNPQKLTYDTGTSAFTLADLGGSPPTGTVGCVHLSRYLIANTPAHPNRIWFSAIPDIEATWDTTNAYIDVDEPVTAMASVAGVLLVWSKNQLWRIIGDIPPGDTGENMQLQPVAQVGCFDGRAVTVKGAVAYFASDSGIYETNGAGVTSLTEKKDSTGIATYWRQLSASFTSGSVFAIAVFKQRWLIVSYTDASGPNFYAFACYLPTGCWTRFSSGFAHMYATRHAFHDAERLYGASIGTNKIFDMTAMFEAATDGSPDADNGSEIKPYWESRVLGGTPGLKAFGHAHVTYDLRAATATGSQQQYLMLLLGSGTGASSSSAPGLVVQAARGIEAPTLATLAESPLAATTDAVRKRVSLNLDSQGVTVALRQTDASALTQIRSVEVEVRQYSSLSEGE